MHKKICRRKTDSLDELFGPHLFNLQTQTNVCCVCIIVMSTQSAKTSKAVFSAHAVMVSVAMVKFVKVQISLGTEMFESIFYTGKV